MPCVEQHQQLIQFATMDGREVEGAALVHEAIDSIRHIMEATVKWYISAETAYLNRQLAFTTSMCGLRAK